MKRISFLFAVLLAATLLIASLFARPEHRGTPPFITACASLSEGDSCTFTGRDGTSIEGTCTEKANPRTHEPELVCWNESAMKETGPPPEKDASR
ncbi:MAG TPA: hypothetical protein PK926_15690 [Spirochaetota bacterium]|nr:hypothetical protein [Spirochaetota bacterium]HPI89351.1 hypothetical protein [Spirochaetota bacterium]HPR48304.1 hypothetical protein [Spirochaetota bacterium]